MRYLHVISAFAGEVWALQPEKLQTLAAFLAFKARGGDYSEAELRARVPETRARAAANAPGGIAVLPMHGVISQRLGMMQEISGGTSTEALAASFRAALDDPAISAIVFDCDTPGGGTYGVDELASEIRAARGVKPIVAQVNSLCASAGYYLASQADEVVITPGGEAGSIGVYAVHQDISRMLEAEGVTPTLIKAGKYKAETSELAPLSADAHDYLQARVDHAHDAFVRAVAAGRKTTQSNVRENFGQGRMFSADAAVKAGLADRVATMTETLQRFGAAPVRRDAAAAARQAFAGGQNPKLSLIEDVLRDAGFPNALAVDFVSRGKGALRSESGPVETPPTLAPATRAALDQLLTRLSS